MTLPYDKNAALIVLPDAAIDQVASEGLRKWLSRGTLSHLRRPLECLQGVLTQLKQPYSTDGIAALRMWGQTGDRPTVWIAAADPIYLEPRLDHLCLHSLQGDALSPGELGGLFDHLQERLAGHERYGFARIGAHGYVRANTEMPTSDLPSYVIDAELPNEYLPVDESGSYHALRGEVEMALHDHAINLQRQSQGKPPVNSLWLWGGGFAPQQETVPQPPLFAENPTLRGYWFSKTGVVADWPGSIADCLEASVAGFVAQPSPSDARWLDRMLQETQDALKSNRISKVTLLLGNRAVLELQHRRNWQIWRRGNSLFEKGN